METKQKGKCPFCEKVVAAEIVEKQFLLSPRRDKCRCPECGETIYVCRTPSCHDYAKGTTVYDHELCPSCSGSLSEGVGMVVKGAGAVAATVVAAVIVNKIEKD